MSDNELPSEAEIEASVKVNMDRLERHHKEIHRILFVETDAAVSMKASEAVKLTRLRCAASDLGRVVGAVAPCSPGCDHCCKMAVSLTYGEAKLIGDRIGIQPIMPKTINMDREELVQKYMGVPCTFLEDGLCSIYDDRPLACRTHFNVSNYPDLCDIIKHPAQSMPAFDFSNMWLGAMEIAIEANDMVFCDLRDFFPHAVNCTDK